MHDSSTLRTWVGRVTAAAPVTPRFVRITIGGLPDFEPRGADPFVYVFLPPPGRTELTVDESFSWEAWKQLPVEERPRGAYYTVRHHRPALGEVDLDVFVHAGRDTVSEWAAGTPVGDAVAIWGPREIYRPPADAGCLLLLGDETAVPAVAGILATLPAAFPVRVLLEVEDAGEEQPLPSGADVELTWLHRDETTLARAVEALEQPPPDGYVWGAGRKDEMNRIRRHLLRDRSLAPERVDVVNYWKR
jgi:NADPH-dependent ferric siderophore reductase